MNKAAYKFLAAGLAMFATPALGIEAPPDDVPLIKVPESASGKVADIADDGAQFDGSSEIIPQGSAYLGVGSGAAPQVLSAHLGLESGVGIVVNSLDPEGPAAKAGFAIYDVILKVGDKSLSSHSDLSAAIREHKPGDELTFDLIHAGKPESRKVVLGERPAGLLSYAAPNPTADLERLLMGMPPEQAGRFRELIERGTRVPGGIHDPTRDSGSGVSELDEVVREMQQQVERTLRGGRSNLQARPRDLNLQNESTFRLRDEKGCVELRNKNGSANVRVLGSDGSVTWSGPWNTEADKAAAPVEVRERVDALNVRTDPQGKGVQLRLGFGNADPLIDQ
jgi:serine protease Do